MKEKIEEIYMDTLQLTDDEWVAKYGEGNGYQEAFTTLIQEERKDAVKNTILSIMSKVPTIMPHDKPDYILRSDFDRAIKEVESEGKE